MFVALCGLACPALADTAETTSLVDAATSDTGQAQYAAIDDLGERATDADIAVPALAKLLDDVDPQVQWRSARALGDFGKQADAAAGRLCDMLGADDPILQYHAAVALGKIEDRSEATVDALVLAVGSSDSRVSRAAVAALKCLRPGPQAVLKALKKALAAEDPAVVVHSLDAIVELGPDAVPLLNEALQDPDTAYLAAAAAEQIGPAAAPTVPTLVELLGETKHSHLQIRVLLALARIGPAAKPAAPKIIHLLEHSTDSTIPVAAAFALGSIGATDAAAPLRQAAAQDKPFLSMVAAWSLAKLHPDDAELQQAAIDKLQAGTHSDDPAIQAAAEKGLKMLATTPANESKTP